MGILEKIQEIEKEMSRTQKNKATESHLGTLKCKLAKYRTQLLEGDKTEGGKGEGFEVVKSGDARVAMIGFPSVGKSSMLNVLTNTKSETANYEFTTLTCVPGVIQYKGANIQLLDLPGIIEGAHQGKGRGRQVIGVARSADVVLMMLDASKGDVHRAILEKELFNCGIRLNCRKPNIYLKVKSSGGRKYNSMGAVDILDEKTCFAIFQEYRIHNFELLIKDGKCTTDDLIDVIEGNRVYMPCVYCYNKVDCLDMEELEKFATQPHSVVTSISLGLNMDYLLATIWRYLKICRVFTKPRGGKPSFENPLIMRSGATVEDVCHGVHRSMADKFKYALVWGTSAKHYPQRVGLKHLVEDEDVVQIMVK